MYSTLYCTADRVISRVNVTMRQMTRDSVANTCWAFPTCSPLLFHTANKRYGEVGVAEVKQI